MWTNCGLVLYLYWSLAPCLLAVADRGKPYSTSEWSHPSEFGLLWLVARCVSFLHWQSIHYCAWECYYWAGYWPVLFSSQIGWYGYEIEVGFTVLTATFWFFSPCALLFSPGVSPQVSSRLCWNWLAILFHKDWLLILEYCRVEKRAPGLGDGIQKLSRWYNEDCLKYQQRSQKCRQMGRCSPEAKCPLGGIFVEDASFTLNDEHGIERAGMKYHVLHSLFTMVTVS